jgi:hypothetical protein
VLQEAVRREEVAGHHGCSLPEARRIHKVVGGLAERYIDSEGDRAVDQDGHHTGRAHRMETAVQEGHHMEMAREVHHKETVQGVHHMEKEQEARRRATELEGVHRKAIVQEVVVLGGKEGHRIGLKAEGQKAWELEEEAAHCFRSRNRMHPLCQSPEQSPWVSQTP